MYMYLYVEGFGLMNLNKSVNFNFSVDFKLFLYSMPINLASLNKYVCIYFLSFHLLFQGFKYSSVFDRSHPLPRNIDATGPTNVFR
jgi:hypothetical protein